MMSRLFICGITSNEYEKIFDLISKTKDFVDGYVWCVDSNPNSDSTYNLLDQNKGQGKIVRHPWQNAHDWQANEWLHCGVLKEGDWVWMFDSSESPTEFWLNGIRKLIAESDKNNISSYYCSGRPYLFKYSEYCYFHGTPHWGLYGLPDGFSVTIKEEDKSTFIINKRNLTPAKHYQEHDTKYYLYGRSNIIDAFYGKYGRDVVNYHEQGRRWFRKHLKELGYEVSLNGLFEYFCDGKFSEEAKNLIEQEFCLSEFYQRVILKMDFMTTMHPRERWSFKNHLEFGDGWHDKNYLGTRLKYEQRAN